MLCKDICRRCNKQRQIELWSKPYSNNDGCVKLEDWLPYFMTSFDRVWNCGCLLRCRMLRHVDDSEYKITMEPPKGCPYTLEHLMSETDQ